MASLETDWVENASKFNVVEHIMSTLEEDLEMIPIPPPLPETLPPTVQPVQYRYKISSINTPRRTMVSHRRFGVVEPSLDDLQDETSMSFPLPPLKTHSTVASQTSLQSAGLTTSPMPNERFKTGRNVIYLLLAALFTAMATVLLWWITTNYVLSSTSFDTSTGIPLTTTATVPDFVTSTTTSMPDSTTSITTTTTSAPSSSTSTPTTTTTTSAPTSSTPTSTTTNLPDSTTSTTTTTTSAPTTSTSTSTTSRAPDVTTSTTTTTTSTPSTSTSTSTTSRTPPSFTTTRMPTTTPYVPPLDTDIPVSNHTPDTQHPQYAFNYRWGWCTYHPMCTDYMPHIYPNLTLTTPENCPNCLNCRTDYWQHISTQITRRWNCTERWPLLGYGYIYVSCLTNDTNGYIVRGVVIQGSEMDVSNNAIFLSIQHFKDLVTTHSSLLEFYLNFPPPPLPPRRNPRINNQHEDFDGTAESIVDYSASVWKQVNDLPEFENHCLDCRHCTSFYNHMVRYIQKTALRENERCRAAYWDFQNTGAEYAVCYNERNEPLVTIRMHSGLYEPTTFKQGTGHICSLPKAIWYYLKQRIAPQISYVTLQYVDDERPTWPPVNFN